MPAPHWWWTTLTDDVWDLAWRGARSYADDNCWGLCAVPDHALTDEILDAMEWSLATWPSLLRKLWQVQYENENVIRAPHCN